MNGGIVIAALGAVLLVMAFKGPDTWTAVWNIVVSSGAKPHA